MAHIVIITNGMPSILNSNIELSRRLRESGHRVTYVAPEDVQTRLEAQGEDVVALTSDRRMAARLASDPRPPAHRLSDVVAWLRRRRALRREAIRDDELTSTVERLAPDLLLIDTEMHTAIIRAAHLGIPILLTMVFFSVFRRRGLPPLHSSAPPPQTASDRWRLAAHWWWIRGEAWTRRVRQWLSRTGVRNLFQPPPLDTVRLPHLRAIARHVGFDLRAATDRSQWLRPHVYRHLPLLSYTAWEMELPHEPPKGIEYVGPMIRLDRTEPALEAHDQSRWASLCAARQGNPTPRPLIYCSLGTVWTADTHFLRRVLDMFAEHPEWDLVLGLGGTLDRSELGAVPANALLLDWAPQLDILAHADAAISHGGVNTLCECAWFGVPAVVCSTQHVDQNGNAVRMAYHRLGVLYDRDRQTADGLASCIEHALTDADIRRHVDAMREHLRRYRDEGRAEQAVARALARSSPDV